MSRSYKKIGIVKDHNKGSKQISKQKIRNAVNQKLRDINLDNDVVLPIEREVVNSYDVCDYKWFSDKPENKRK